MIYSWSGKIKIWEVIQGPARPNIGHIQAQLHCSSETYKIALWFMHHGEVISHINGC